MALALRKALTARWRRAKLIGGLVKNSIVFTLKKSTVRKRFYRKPIDSIIVDMDGTVFRADSAREAMSFKFNVKVHGTPLGELLYAKSLRDIANGRVSVEEAMINGNKLLVKSGFRKGDFRRLLNIVKKKLRKELILALKEIRRKQPKTKIILATHSSSDFSELLNSFLKKRFKFRFDGIIGTKMSFDKKGRLNGLNEIIATKTHRIGRMKFKTKLSALKELFQKKGWIFDKTKSLLITDSYSDMDLAKVMRTILLKQKRNPNLIQKLSQKLRLADAIVEDNKLLGKSIESIVLEKKFKQKRVKKRYPYA